MRRHLVRTVASLYQNWRIVIVGNALHRHARLRRAVGFARAAVFGWQSRRNALAVQFALLFLTFDLRTRGSRTVRILLTAARDFRFNFDAVDQRHVVATIIRRWRDTFSANANTGSAQRIDFQRLCDLTVGASAVARR